MAAKNKSSKQSTQPDLMQEMQDIVDAFGGSKNFTGLVGKMEDFLNGVYDLQKQIIKEFRADLNMTLAQTAAELNLPPDYLEKAENASNLTLHDYLVVAAKYGFLYAQKFPKRTR